MIFLDGGVAYKITEECSYTRVELTVPHAHSGTLQGVVYGHRESPVCGLWFLCYVVSLLNATLQPSSMRPSLPSLLLLICVYLLTSKSQKML